MAELKVVLDTNAILRSISRRSEFSVVLEKLYEGAYELCVTNDILLEYEEKISDIFSKETAELIIGALSLLPNVKKSDIYYHLQLIDADKDDNKFSDCAFAANAHCLVTNDKHFNVLKIVPFPSINIMTLETFKSLLLSDDKVNQPS
jgi:putative PIN family toxin of toxin-antitoxin system